MMHAYVGANMLQHMCICTALLRAKWVMTSKVHIPLDEIKLTEHVVEDTVLYLL